MEEKRAFIELLETVLIAANVDVCSLELVDNDTVMIHYFGGGKRRINIACDSKIAIIKDVVSRVD